MLKAKVEVEGQPGDREGDQYYWCSLGSSQDFIDQIFEGCVEVILLEARSMARLGIEPRPTGYIPGALPLSYLALGNQVG